MDRKRTRRTSILLFSDGVAKTLQAADIIAHNRAEGVDVFPPLRAIISSYPLSKLDLFSTPRADWENLLSSQQAIGLAWEQLLAQECNTAHKVETVSADA